MKSILLLSVFLLCTGPIAFSQEKRGTEASAMSVPATEKGLIKITIMYPYAEGKTFNMEYYETKHMPMVAGYLGENLVRYTIEKGLSAGRPGQPLPYMAIGTFYVKRLNEYQAAIAPHVEKIRADFANYTNVVPVILVSEVVR